MKYIRILPIVSLFLLLFAGSALADSITLTGTGGLVQGSVYVAPYYLSVVSGGTTTNYSVMCDSFYNLATVGSTWTGTTNTWTTLNNAKFGSISGFNSGQAYTEAAWLFMQFAASPNNPTAGGTNYAVWSLFRNAYQTPLDSADEQMFQAGYNATGSTAQVWLTAAGNWYSDASDAERASYLDQLLIFTPAGTTNTSVGTQEYITMSPVPEPSSLLLLGSGLAGILGMLRRKILSYE